MTSTPRIAPSDLERWAEILLDHSLGGIDESDRVMIKGERACWPLIEVLERRVIEAGAVPDVLLVPPNNERGKVFSSAMARHGDARQLASAAPWVQARYEWMTKYIEVLGAEDPSRYSDLDDVQSQAITSADRPYATIRLRKPWVLTLFPTAGFAAMEGLALDAYSDFLVRASTADPNALRAAEEKLAPFVDAAQRMTIETYCPQQKRDLSLTLSLAESVAVMSFGLRNLPDGEVFTSPDANSVEGEIYIDLPVNYGGVDIEGIFLRFEGGRITRYSAERGGDKLRTIIETDAGSHRLGEVAFGMNPSLERVLKHPLLVEKVGGTLHIAIGQSYDVGFEREPAGDEAKARIQALAERGVFNRSAQHVDIVCDFRPGGCGRRVLLDDVEIRSHEGIWVAPQ